jgi:DNA polymerase-3 subunit delta
MELEKIEIFAKEGKKITAENIAKLTNLVENHSISELVDNCLAKNKHKTINILVENNFSNEDCVQITRIFLNKLKKILKLSTEYQKNKDLDLTISLAKPPIFWKEKEITKQQIINSNPEKLRRSLFKVNEIELLIKKNYENSINLITDFIMTQLSTRVNN